ncbi:MAG: alpha-L-fucosidase [Bacteroidaceae bacterium]|nr:alpha-L-fucosidase [Bacteroidaceae bacterium]
MKLRQLLSASALTLAFLSPVRAQDYVPSPENLQARQAFSDMKFGIFLHWGIYSLFGQGEWYMQNANLDWREYEKAASAFYPSRFDAQQWVSAIKDAGARYITITSRHHDGFSMWQTAESDFNIVDATPFRRDVLCELADACHQQGVMLNFYYSHLDWRREDYPLGRTGHGTHRDTTKADWASYYAFMNRQLTELLTGYGPVGAIWFDGYWDHDSDAVPFDWQLTEQYELIHRLQPACLVGNNHHVNVHPGEDIQIFERDVPGENTAGYSGDMAISRLPLETCQTMNGMWGYKIVDQNYKSTEELLRLLVRTAGKGANLLLNIGPQPNGELPATALQRLREMGQWLRTNGESIYGTTAGDLAEQPWGVTTRKGSALYLHLLHHTDDTLVLPLTCKVKKATLLDGTPVKMKQTKKAVVLQFPQKPSGVDYIVKLMTKP